MIKTIKKVKAPNVAVAYHSPTGWHYGQAIGFTKNFITVEAPSLGRRRLPKTEWDFIFPMREEKWRINNKRFRCTKIAEQSIKHRAETLIAGGHVN